MATDPFHDAQQVLALDIIISHSSEWPHHVCQFVGRALASDETVLVQDPEMFCSVFEVQALLHAAPELSVMLSVSKGKLRECIPLLGCLSFAPTVASMLMLNAVNNLPRCKYLHDLANPPQA